MGNDGQKKVVVVNSNNKSIGLALILTFLFGGLGMFYVSILSGILWTMLEIVIGIVTVGAGLVILHPLMMIIAVISIKNQNKKKAQKTKQFIEEN
ncbi:MAG: hypothetical protein ACQEQC_07870 [Elusimicrobiota bacterium]